MIYYGNNDWRDYLAHHGILGQRWGKRNGPPYPLSYGSHSASEKKAGWRNSLSVGATKTQKDTGTRKAIEKKQKAVAENLVEELNTEWDYGVMTSDGRRLTEENSGLDNFNYGRDYRTLPLEKLRKEKIGTCWDFVNYQHDVLKKAGIKDSAYLIVMRLPTNDDPDRTITHTFSTLKVGDKEYWLESAMWPKRGLHEIKDFKDAATQIHDQYTKTKTPYSLFKYDPEGMDKGLTDTEFFDRATDGNWLMDVNVK